MREPGSKMSEAKRALRLAGLLMHEGLNQDADEEMREIFLKKLKEMMRLEWLGERASCRHIHLVCVCMRSNTADQSLYLVPVSCVACETGLDGETHVCECNQSAMQTSDKLLPIRCASLINIAHSRVVPNKSHVGIISLPFIRRRRNGPLIGFNSWMESKWTWHQSIDLGGRNRASRATNSPLHSKRSLHATAFTQKQLSTLDELKHFFFIFFLVLKRIMVSDALLEPSGPIEIRV